MGQVQSVLVKKLSVLDKYEHILSQVNAVAMERLIDPKTQVNIQSVCDDPAILAQQLTHIELVRESSCHYQWLYIIPSITGTFEQYWPRRVYSDICQAF